MNTSNCFFFYMKVKVKYIQNYKLNYRNEMKNKMKEREKNYLR